MKIVAKHEYDMFQKQQSLFAQFVETLDPRWVYEDERYKKFLERCSFHDLNPIEENKFLEGFESYLVRNPDIKKQAKGFALTSYVELVISDLRSEETE